MDPDEAVRLLVILRKQHNDALVRLENLFAKYIKGNEKKVAEYIPSLVFSQKELQDVKAELCVAKREIAASAPPPLPLRSQGASSCSPSKKLLDYLDDHGTKGQPSLLWSR